MGGLGCERTSRLVLSHPNATLKQLFGLVRETLGTFKPGVVPIEPQYGTFWKGDVPHSLAGISRARTLAWYEPPHDVMEGMKITMEWYSCGLAKETGPAVLKDLSGEGWEISLVLHIICFLLVGAAVLICGYYWFLALYALLKKPRRPALAKDPRHSFAIVIPAHNEEQVISKTLESCAQLDYPREKFRVFVVADNCSDRTGRVAAQSGVTVLERHDEKQKGKGFALAWAFQRILPQGHDAMVVIDADCSIDASALRIFDGCLSSGERVLQANDAASNPDASPMSYALAVGNLIENVMFYAPKSQLGLAVFLRGTGMVFHRDILDSFPWAARSIVEDVEYAVSLLREGIKVSFVDAVEVRSEFPEMVDQLNVQRKRWASGNFEFAKRYALKLAWEGLIKREWWMLDAGWTFLILSRPLVLVELLLALVFAFLLAWFLPNPLSVIFCLFAFITALFQGLYFLLGTLLLGITLKRLSFLLRTPLVVARLIFISVKGLAGAGGKAWEKTPR